MIAVDQLSKSYGAHRALVDATLTAPDGCITGVLGLNGAGKTTLFRIAAGLMRADAGGVHIDGMPMPSAARASLGMLPHAAGLYGRLTVREHVVYFGELRGMQGARLAAAVDETLHICGLEALASRRAHGLSQGERVRVALACVLVHRPRHLILDEPTSGLDVLSTRALHAHLRTLRGRGVSVLFATHVMSEAAALCDRVVILARGRVVAETVPSELSRYAGSEGFEDAFVALASSAEGAR